MKIAVMQPYLFPYIGYFQLINDVDRFVIYDDVNFIKKGWINRNNILVNGKANLFTVPLKNSSQNKLINEIKIIQDNKWKQDLLKTIELNYKKAPYYNNVYKLISRIIYNEENNLSEYIYYSFIELNNYLNINTKIIKSSSVYFNNDIKQQERIIDICKIENAIDYLNPIGGTELYSKALFKLNGINLNFISSKDFVYEQFNNVFVKSLSIIDIMMFNSKEKISEFLKEVDIK